MLNVKWHQRGIKIKNKKIKALPRVEHQKRTKQKKITIKIITNNEDTNDNNDDGKNYNNTTEGEREIAWPLAQHPHLGQIKIIIIIIIIIIIKKITIKIITNNDGKNYNNTTEGESEK